MNELAPLDDYTRPQLSRRGFLKLLAALPGAAALASIPDFVRPSQVLDGLASVAEASVAEASPLGTYIEIDGIRFAVNSLVARTDYDTIDVTTTIGSMNKEYVTGAARSSVYVETFDARTNMLLRGTGYADINVVLTKPAYVINGRGYIGDFEVSSEIGSPMLTRFMITFCEVVSFMPA